MTTNETPSSGRPAISDNEVIERFGGIRPMAAKLGAAVTTVQGWKERGHIPPSRWPQIAAAAAAHGIDLGEGATAAPPAETPAASQRTAAAPEPPARPTPPEPSSAPKETKGPPPPVAGKKPAAAEPATAEPEPAPAKEPVATEQRVEAPPPARAAGGGIAWLALMVAVAFAVAVLTRPFWEPVIHGGDLAGAGPGDPAALAKVSAQLAAIEDSLGQLARDSRSRGDTLDARVSALEAGGGEAGAAFAGQLAALETRMADLSGALATVSGSLSRMEERLARLEAMQKEVPGPVRQELEGIGARLDELQAGIAAREESFRAQDTVLSDGLKTVGSTLANLDSRLSELEARPIQTGEKIAALSLAVGQVEAALNSGRPFRAALDRLTALGHDDPLISDGTAIAELEPWADQGIPDRLSLRRRYIELMPQIARELAGAEEEGWVDSVWNSIKGLVTIRRIDGDGDVSPVGRAEMAMERGDLAAAAAAFEGVDNLGPEGNGWLTLVQARIAAEREIDALYGQVIAPLAGTAGAGANAQ